MDSKPIHTVFTRRGIFGSIPGNKLSGYYHQVSSRQRYGKLAG
jgi:hypothetical protein